MKANDPETVTLQPGSVRVAQSSFAFQLHRHLGWTDDLRLITVGTRSLSVLVLENGYYLLATSNYISQQLPKPWRKYSRNDLDLVTHLL
jgi:hypothetical protein